MELKEDHFVSQSQTEIRMDFFRVFSDFVDKLKIAHWGKLENILS